MRHGQFPCCLLLFNLTVYARPGVDSCSNIIPSLPQLEIVVFEYADLPLPIFKINSKPERGKLVFVFARFDSVTLEV